MAEACRSPGARNLGFGARDLGLGEVAAAEAVGSRQEARGEGRAAAVVEFSVDSEFTGQYYIQ